MYVKWAVEVKQNLGLTYRVRGSSCGPAAINLFPSNCAGTLIEMWQTGLENQQKPLVELDDWWPGSGAGNGGENGGEERQAERDSASLAELLEEEEQRRQLSSGPLSSVGSSSSVSADREQQLARGPSESSSGGHNNWPDKPINANRGPQLDERQTRAGPSLRAELARRSDRQGGRAGGEEQQPDESGPAPSDWRPPATSHFGAGLPAESEAELAVEPKWRATNRKQQSPGAEQVDGPLNKSGAQVKQLAGSWPGAERSAKMRDKSNLLADAWVPARAAKKAADGQQQQQQAEFNLPKRKQPMSREQAWPIVQRAKTAASDDQSEGGRQDDLAPDDRVVRQFGQGRAPAAQDYDLGLGLGLDLDDESAKWAPSRSPNGGGVQAAAAKPPAPKLASGTFGSRSSGPEESSLAALSQNGTAIKGPGPKSSWSAVGGRAPSSSSSSSSSSLSSKAKAESQERLSSRASSSSSSAATQERAGQPPADRLRQAPSAAGQPHAATPTPEPGGVSESIEEAIKRQIADQLSLSSPVGRQLSKQLSEYFGEPVMIRVRQSSVDSAKSGQGGPGGGGQGGGSASSARSGPQTRAHTTSTARPTAH